jgi:hypothetical protein
MLLDYIYLIIIIALICFVLFMIYISYEYRVFDVNEPFSQFDLLSTESVLNDNYRNNLREFNKKYSDAYVNAYNQQMLSDNTSLNSLLGQYQANYDKSKMLVEKNNTLIQTPKTFPINEVIKTIKSNYNSQYLSTSANDINKYGVMVNDKCFTVNGLCKDEFCLQECQKGLYVTDSQKFYTNRIYSSADAANIMGVQPNQINSKNVYPFNIFRSSVNDKCLTINDDGVGIQPCNLNLLNQQWSISPDENICVLK